MRRKLEALTGRRRYIPGVNMIRMALNKYAISHSSADASEIVRTQADVDLGRLVTSMSTVHYLAWAIPAIGFIGTVRGLASAMPLASQMMNADPGKDNQLFTAATAHLDVAFDCTLVALVLSLGIMFLLHTVQRDEESLVIDCQQYCQEHLVTRLYILEPEPRVATGLTKSWPLMASRSRWTIRRALAASGEQGHSMSSVRTSNRDRSRPELDAQGAPPPAGLGQSARALSLDARHAELPLALALDGRVPEVGERGLSLQRKAPHSACVDFLPFLGERRHWGTGQAVASMSNRGARIDLHSSSGQFARGRHPDAGRCRRT